jgi:hypothetical protein
MRPTTLQIMEERSKDMKVKRFWPLYLAVLLVVVLLGSALFVTRASAGGQKYRWDIISVDFAAGTLGPGGIASASANDGSSITLTGEGTFNAASNFGNRDVTGGGTWQTFNAAHDPTASGTYQVTGFVSFTVAPGAAPPLKDLIGNPANARAGLLFVTIQYSDGSTGVLTVSCHIPGPPAAPESIFEGITVSMGYTDYWNRQAPPAPPGNANRTTFHILP